MCPECSSHMLDVSGVHVICKLCGFKIRSSKVEDIVKGKDSIAYKKAVANYMDLKKRDKKNKLKKIVSKKIQDDERLSLLNRMLCKGEISQEEYNSKISPIKVKRSRIKRNKLIEITI